LNRKSHSFTMKVSSNLSFLLCISSVAVPAIDARANGFVPQQPRSLQTDGQLEVCNAFLEILFGPNSGCECGDDGEVDLTSSECAAFIAGCSPCDTVQGQRACYTLDAEESAASSSVDALANCYTFDSGPFVGITNCVINNFADGTCTITTDGTECNSCAVIACNATDGAGKLETSYDIDCSNVIEGETWNLCTDDIPETSRFLSNGNNDRFLDVGCGSGDSEDSGSLVLSFRGLSVLASLIFFAAFW
jgi:hypothetical protein